MGRFRNVCISKWSFSCFWRFDIRMCLAYSTHRCRWLGICEGDTCILGEERWLPRFPTHRRRWLCGGAKGCEGDFQWQILVMNSTHRRRWLWGDPECWRCCYTCNSPAPVTLGGSEGIQPCKKQNYILTLQTHFFFATSTKYFHKHIFFGFSLEKKHWVVGLIDKKFSCESRKYMWFSKSPAPVTLHNNIRKRVPWKVRVRPPSTFSQFSWCLQFSFDIL